MSVYLTILLSSLVGFFIHLFVSKKPKTISRIVELFLLYQLVFCVGITSLLAFYGFAFLPKMVADFIGWPECPFEIELANVNLAFGVLGILCIWLRGNFWIATVIGISIWLLGDAIHHIIDMYINHNYAAGNIGVPLYTDIIVPIELIILLAIHLKLERKKKEG